MFIHVINSKGKSLSINIFEIVRVVEKNNGCIVYEREGLDWYIEESYTDFMSKLDKISNNLFLGVKGVKQFKNSKNNDEKY